MAKLNFIFNTLVGITLVSMTSTSAHAMPKIVHTQVRHKTMPDKFDAISDNLGVEISKKLASIRNETLKRDVILPCLTQMIDHILFVNSPRFKDVVFDGSNNIPIVTKSPRDDTNYAEFSYWQTLDNQSIASQLIVYCLSKN